MKLFQSLLKRTLLIMVSAALFTSCVRDVIFSPGGTDTGTVTFTIDAPASALVQTKASVNGTALENSINDVHLFVFNNSTGDLIKVFTPSVSAGTLTVTTAGSLANNNQYTFSGSLPVGQYDFIALANVTGKTSVSGSPTFDYTGVETKSDFIDEVVEKLFKEHTTAWTLTSSGDIPMWGELTKTITATTTSVEVPVCRMVARVNVNVVGTTTRSDFKLQTVSLTNNNTIGQVIPESSPSIPLAAGKIVASDKSFLTFTANDDTRCEEKIYMFETENEGEYDDGTADWLDNPCIIIGGKYKNGPTTYYRLDFIDNVGDYLDVLRNHSYLFNITSVKGPGFSTETDALFSAPMNIEADVLPWDDGQIGDVIFDGQYLMGVNPGMFNIDKSVQTGTITISTNWANKPDVVFSSDPDDASIAATWLSQNSYPAGVPGTNGKTNYTLTFDAPENDGIGSRTEYIHIKAGRLTYVVTVTQSDMITAGISLTKNGNPVRQLIFASAVDALPAPQTLVVDWSPRSTTLSVTTENPLTGYNTFSFASGSPIVTGALTSGPQTYAIQPPAITAADVAGDPFFERQMTATYRLMHNGQMFMENITLQQFVYNADYSKESIYLLDGNNHSFTVKANVPWRAILIDDGSNTPIPPAVNGKTVINTASLPIVTGGWLIGTGGYNLPDGADVNFETLNDLLNPTIYQGTAKVRIEAMGGEFTPITVELNCASGILGEPSNSYIIHPNGAGILIPVKRANGYRSDGTTVETGWPLSNQVTNATNFTAELLWSDIKGTNNTGLDTDGTTPIRRIQIVGSGENALILVLPGSVEGNSVVAIKDGTNILWSWHIWVTPFNDQDDTLWKTLGTTVFMDRYLGAFNTHITSGHDGNYSKTGLLYQWGRKDPTVTAASSSNTNPTLYTAGATTTAVTTATTPTTSSNLINAVRNPLVIYYGTVAMDWYTNAQASVNHDLWGGVSNVKTIYDPCPAGWRVPTATTGANPWASLTVANGSINKGYTWTSPYDAGYYPYTGWRSASTGTIQAVGTKGSVWAATRSATAAYQVYAFGLNTNLSGNSIALYSTHRADAFPVRCVRITNP